MYEHPMSSLNSNLMLMYTSKIVPVEWALLKFNYLCKEQNLYRAQPVLYVLDVLLWVYGLSLLLWFIMGLNLSSSFDCFNYRVSVSFLLEAP